MRRCGFGSGRTPVNESPRNVSLRHFAGLDWASRVHAVCAIDEKGKIVSRFDVAHDQTGIASLVERLSHIKNPIVAIERPAGVLIDTLLDANIETVAVHPNIVKAVRSCYRTAGKSAAGAAYVLAALLRIDGHCFKALVPHCTEIKSLRMLVRLQKDSVQTRVGPSNRSRSLLNALYRVAACIFAEIDSPIALAFLRQFPS